MAKKGREWTVARERAAGLVAQSNAPDCEIAAAVGVTRQTLGRWRRAASFQQRVEEYLQAAREAALRAVIDDVERRVASLDGRCPRCGR